MTGWSGVEDDVIVNRRSEFTAQQFGELIECGDLYRARPRELFFHAVDRGLGQYAAIGSNDTFPIGFCRCFRIDIQSEQAVRARDGRGFT